MKLEFKPDFEESRLRFGLFWKNENENPLVSVVTPKEGVVPIDKPPYMAGHKGEFEPVIEQIYKWASSHEFIGDAIPFYQVEFGPDHFSAFLGADLKYSAGSNSTSWAVPFVSDWDKAEIKFRKDSFWWERTIKFIRALRKEFDGKLLIAAPTLSAGMDCLAAVRGTQELLMDTVECPEKVLGALEALWLAYKEIADGLFSELNSEETGSINRHGVYSAGKTAVPQCDFSCMISPEMFEMFAVPFIEKETRYLDNSEYHLDGPGALVHLKRICSLPKLDIVQWVPGAGEAALSDWTELYLKIDALGKGMIMHEPPEYYRKLMPMLKTRKLFLKATAPDKQSGEKLYREIINY